MQYAAYGSNLHPLRLKARIPSAQPLGTSYMPDWGLHFHKRSVDRSGKCNIIAPGNGLYLAIYQIDDADKSKLDAVEGVGNGYDDGTISVAEFGKCFTYFATKSHMDDTLQPYDWYKQIVLLGCKKLRLPYDYISEIDAIVATQDPCPSRRERNWNVVKMLQNDT